MSSSQFPNINHINISNDKLLNSNDFLAGPGNLNFLKKKSLAIFGAKRSRQPNQSEILRSRRAKNGPRQFSTLDPWLVDLSNSTSGMNTGVALATPENYGGVQQHYNPGRNSVDF